MASPTGRRPNLDRPVGRLAAVGEDEGSQEPLATAPRMVSRMVWEVPAWSRTSRNAKYASLASTR